MKKIKLLTSSDLVRIVYGFEITSREEGYIAVVAMLHIENLLEKYFGVGDSILNLFSKTPLWLELLGKTARTGWATRWAQRDPIESTTMGIFLTAARQYSAMLQGEEIIEELPAAGG